jgi:hypothetical protein
MTTMPQVITPIGACEFGDHPATVFRRVRLDGQTFDVQLCIVHDREFRGVITPYVMLARRAVRTSTLPRVTQRTCGPRHLPAGRNVRAPPVRRLQLDPELEVPGRTGYSSPNLSAQFGRHHPQPQPPQISVHKNSRNNASHPYQLSPDHPQTNAPDAPRSAHTSPRFGA